MSGGLNPGHVPLAVQEALRRLEAAGHEAFLVGGAVRDLLLDRLAEEPDWDVATSAPPRAVMGLFERVIPTGIEHGTVTVLVDETEGTTKLEVTTYRGEGGYSDGRRPDAVEFLERIEEDLARRDFTVNALAWNPLHDDLRDPFGGAGDLEAGVLRAVGEAARRFAEDGLRPLRAVRFASVLGFEIEAGTLAAIPGALGVYEKVAVERLAQEMAKLLLGPEVDRGLSLLLTTGLAARIVAGQAGLFRDRGALRGLPVEALPRWAGFLAPAGPQVAVRTLEGLRLSRALQREVGTVLEVHGRGLPGPEDGPGLRSRLSGLAGVPEALDRLCEALASLYQAIDGPEGSRAASALRAEWATRPPLVPGDLALSGRQVMTLLGSKGGPEVGETLRALLAWVLEDPGRNQAARLEARLRELPREPAR